MGLTSDEENDNVSSSKSKNTESKGRSKHRIQRYRPEWERNSSEFGADVGAWLQPDPDNKFKAKCKWCQISVTANTTCLKDHKNSQKHKLMKSSRGDAGIMNRFLAAGTSSKMSVPQNVTKAEIVLSGCFAAHNVPYKFMDHLVPALKAVFPDSEICRGIQMKRMKCTNIITNVIGASHKNDIAAVLKTTKFSLLTDESTHFGAKTSAVVVRFYDKSIGRVVSRFFDLSDVFPKGDTEAAEQGATGARLFDLIMTSLRENGVPVENLVGFASDGASVMIGDHNSVFSRLKEKCPGVILLRCICHSLHLAASDACKQLPRSCEDLARSLYSFFHHSSKRTAQLVEFQEFLEIKVHRMLHPAQTRWLSLTEVVERVLEQWEALRLFITSAWLEDRTIAAENLYKWLNDPFIKLHFIFLSWVLPKVTEMNAFFQSSTVVVTSLHEKMSRSFKELLQAYLNPPYVAKTNLAIIRPDLEDQYARIDNLYLGVGVMQELNKSAILARQDLIEAFKINCRNFLVALCKGIQLRYHFSDSVLSSLPALQPKKAMSHERKFASIVQFSELIPRAKPENPTTLQQLDDEWRRLPFETLPEDVREEAEVDVFWHKIGQLTDSDGTPKYSVLPDFVLAVLSLPHSNAECERIFSKVTANKTKHRSCILTKNVEGILLASQCVKKPQECCAEFAPTKDMFSRMTSNILYGQTTSRSAGSDKRTISNRQPGVSSIDTDDENESDY